MTDFDQARALFLKKDYQAALAAANKALVGLPNDPIIHEFRALVQFALATIAKRPPAYTVSSPSVPVGIGRR